MEIWSFMVLGYIVNIFGLSLHFQVRNFVQMCDQVESFKSNLVVTWRVCIILVLDQPKDGPEGTLYEQEKEG